MRKNLLYSTIFLLAGGLFLTSCHKEYFQLGRLSDEMEIHTDLVAPLLYGSMTMSDIVALFDSSGFVGEFEDGLIYLTYADTLVDVMVDTLDLVVDGLYSEIYYDAEIGDNPIFIGSSIGDTVHFTKSKYFSFETVGDNRLDSILFKGGELLTEMESTFQHAGFLTVSSEYILDSDRNPYTYTMVISDPSGDFSWSESHELDGYFLETDQQGDSSVFRMDYDLALINSGNPVNPGDFCEINSSFLDMGFYSLFGFVDPNEVVSESGVLDIPIYSDVPELTHLKLADPRINIFTESSLGIPFELEVDSVIATAENGTTETLEFYEGHPFIIPAPTIDMVGETAYGEFHINNQTSNFQDLLNIAPHTLSYRVTGDIGSQSQNHFLLDTSRFMTEAEFMLPLDLSFSEYALVDTLEFEVGEEGLDTSIVKDVVIALSTVNELPIELGMQVYLLDETYMVLDSVFDGDPVFLTSSDVDSEGRLLAASEDSNSINFPAEKLGTLEQTQFIRIEARMVTSGAGDQFVKFYSDYSLDFEISFYANLRINTREL
ncbi:MAG: hypothetical protein KAS82_06275 [Bacteroidales bacterium]|nr:hypothetical protein [Bacteroidales bacterium]